MTVIRAHYDGKAIVPDEPVDIPVNQPLHVELRVVSDDSDEPASPDDVWQQLLSRRIKGVVIPADRLKREDLYEDRV